MPAHKIQSIVSTLGTKHFVTVGSNIIAQNKELFKGGRQTVIGSAIFTVGAGTLFIGAGEKLYAGMVVGQTGRSEDIELNVCKKKQLTNTRSSSADEALRLTPPRILSLEQALDFIDTDELLEVTPLSLRIRKKILDPTLRKRAAINKK